MVSCLPSRHVEMARGVCPGALEQFALVEDGASTDQGDQVWGVDGTPTGLCGVDQRVDHGNSGCAGSRAFGDLGPQPHGGKSAFDRVRGAQMDPMLGRILVELQQHVGVVDDHGDRLGVLGAVVDLERLDRELGLVDVLDRAHHFRASANTCLKVLPFSTFNSRGSPSTRSAIPLRCISLLPPEIE